MDDYEVARAAVHPFDAFRARELLLRTSSHNSHQLSSAENFMTSKEPDDTRC